MLVAEKKQKRKKRPPTVDALAARFGKSRQTIQEWFRRGCPRGSIEEIEKWRQATAKAPESSKLARAERIERIRGLREARRERQLQNDQRAGNLIERDEAIQRLSLAFGIVRARMEQLIESVNIELPQDLRPSIGARVDELVRLALKEAANEVRGLDAPGGSSG